MDCLCLLWIRPNSLVLWTQVPQVGHMCEKRVAGSVGRRRPSCTRNCLPHTRRWLTCPETIDVVTDFWQKGHEYTYSFCGGGFCSMSFGIATSCVPSFSLVMVWPVCFFCILRSLAMSRVALGFDAIFCEEVPVGLWSMQQPACGELLAQRQRGIHCIFVCRFRQKAAFQ